MDKQRIQKIGKNIVRWGIAIVGIAWVVMHMSWHDHVLAILPGQTAPTRDVRVAQDDASDADAFYSVIDPASGQTIQLDRNSVINEPDRKNYTVFAENKTQYVVGVDLSDDLNKASRVLLADKPDSRFAHWLPAAEVPGYHLTVPHPRVQIGVLRMIRGAKSHLNYLLAAVLIFPLTILITGFRWHELLKALDIHLTLARVFELTMVGLFFNTFLLGSTGGDFVKALYVQRQTHHRTRAVMSVLIDRAIGLLALIMLGGTMAALQWRFPTCRKVALSSGAIVAVTALGAVLFYVPALKKLSGLDFILNRLAAKSKKLSGAIYTMNLYGRRPLLAVGVLLISFPVHIVVIIAAWLCGVAFGLHVSPFYYWMAVPVIVLAGAIPISPQGAGVMEFFAIKLLEPQGVTVAQAFALTMSIRLTPLLWNLLGGYFVLRGGYHAPTQSEQQQAENEPDNENESAIPQA